MKRLRATLGVSVLTLVAVLVSCRPQTDPRLKGALRRPEQNGWIFVRLEGPPRQLGYQHGHLLAKEILDLHRTISAMLPHDAGKDWQFFRKAAEEVLWPGVEEEYRRELEGIVEGVVQQGGKLDIWDLVAMNAFTELAPYYTRWYDRQQGARTSSSRSAPEHCSAFVATGSYTRDGKVVMGHNAWTDYAVGARWNIIFDLNPDKGHHVLMDGLPGLIHSGDDFGLNSAGLLITETTISGFHGFDPKGIPEFVRARKAMQYAASIDQFAAIMKQGNNGGYANNWLVADRKTSEIASLELGLKNVSLRRTRDGYFAGANFPVDPKLAREETTFDLKDPGASANARRARWDQLMAEYKGKVDASAGERFLSDHYDTYAQKEDPNERTLCGHIDLSPRGSKPWQPPFGPAGAVQAKVTDAAMAEAMTLRAAMGHSCGLHFKAAEFLKRRPEFSWQKELLPDLDSRPWTTFSAQRRPAP